MTLLSQAEYARHLGVSRPSITQWKKAGRLVLQGDQVDVEASDAMLEKYRRDGLPDGARTVKQGQKPVKEALELNEFDADLTLSGESIEAAAERLISANGADMSVEEAKRVKENYLAKLAQLDYDIKSGRVVDATAVAEVVGTEYSKVRTKLLAIPTTDGLLINAIANGSQTCVCRPPYLSDAD